MSDDLSIQGTLAETTVPDLFRSIIRSSETAILSLDAIGRNDTIYFHEGRIVFAASTDQDTGLAETLLRLGELDIQQYEQAMERLVVSRRIGAMLIELGYLKPDELTRAVERQASGIVLNAISYRGGNYTMEFTPLPDGILHLPLQTERLILDGVHRIEYWSLITRGINRFDRVLEKSSGADIRIYQIELTEEEGYVMSLLSESAQSVEQLCARSYLSNFQTVRTLWGLLAVNLVQDAASGMLGERRAAEETEYELEALVERYNTLFQTIFGLVMQKIGDHIYDFMDRVTRHVSPETMPYLSGMTMVNEGRIDFDQLLNNLYSSGSADHATVVNSVLNELLTGWIFEIRAEFGAQMETEIVKLTEAIRR